MQVLKQEIDTPAGKMNMTVIDDDDIQIFASEGGVSIKYAVGSGTFPWDEVEVTLESPPEEMVTEARRLLEDCPFYEPPTPKEEADARPKSQP